jgi:hypothetical protein
MSKVKILIASGSNAHIKTLQKNLKSIIEKYRKAFGGPWFLRIHRNYVYITYINRIESSCIYLYGFHDTIPTGDNYKHLVHSFTGIYNKESR